MDPLGIFDRLFGLLREYQFRIPEPVMWVSLASASLAISVGPGANNAPVGLVAGAVVLVCLAGIARWHWHRRCARGGLVVVRFAAPATEQLQEEVQRLTLASLRDNLSPEEAALVHGVPVVVGSDDRDFAIALRRRLGARFLLHGRVAPSGSGYSVYARVVQPIDRSVAHLDSVTRDVTFERASWRNLINRLTPSRDVIDEEYPLEFASEVEAVVRGTAGQLAADQDDVERAERLLTDALSVAPNSTSHQIDLLRTWRARAIFDLDREGEAINSLMPRAQDPTAAPELLRALDGLLFLQGGENRTEASRAEGERALRAAVAQRSDPQRDLSTYNLAMVTRDNAESAALLDELLASRSHYRNAWYVRRQRAAAYWGEAEAIREASGIDAARPVYAQAARFYTQAIRRRPQFKLLVSRRALDAFWYRTPPVMYANAADAHRGADHRMRTRWYTWRSERVRGRFFKRAERAFFKGNWPKAANYFAHVIMVRDDPASTVARVFQAVAVKQLGDDAGAEMIWQEALSRDPVALSWRAALVHDASLGLTPADLPGDEPTGVQEVNAMIDALTRSPPT